VYQTSPFIAANPVLREIAGICLCIHSSFSSQ